MKILGIFLARPLTYATFTGDAALVDYLIGKGANPNDTDDDGITRSGSPRSIIMPMWSGRCSRAARK